VNLHGGTISSLLRNLQYLHVNFRDRRGKGKEGERTERGCNSEKGKEGKRERGKEGKREGKREGERDRGREG
jgi:hypothetical protein